MATWSQLQEAVRKSYPLEYDDPDAFAVTLARREGDASREQMVKVRRYEAWGQDFVEFRSAFGELVDYDIEKLLADGLQLPLGAIAAHGTVAVVIHKSPLVHLTVEGALFLMTRICLLADLLEARSGRDRF